MLEGIKHVRQMGFRTGVVMNVYLVTTEEDAELWSTPPRLPRLRSRFSPRLVIEVTTFYFTLLRLAGKVRERSEDMVRSAGSEAKRELCHLRRPLENSWKDELDE